METQATPRPWTVEGANDPGICHIADNEGQLFAEVVGEKPAALIVTAVNNHDALIEALEDTADRLEQLTSMNDERLGPDPTLLEARAVLAQIAAKEE